MPDTAPYVSSGAFEASDVAAKLLAASSVTARARLIVSWITSALPDTACVLYRFEGGSESSWRAIALAGDISLSPSFVAHERPLFAPLVEDPQGSIRYTQPELKREDYAHLESARSVSSIGLLPVRNPDQPNQLVGAAEILTFSEPLSIDDLESCEPLLRLAAPALLEAETSEQQRQKLLDSVHRLTQLYDLEKSLNATLDLDRVMALVPRKTQAMLLCHAVHLWLFDGDVLAVKATAGSDPTVRIGTTQSAGEGYVGDMAEEGEPLLIDGSDPDDERLRLRNAGSSAPVWTAMLVPLLQDEAEVGVLEAINKSNGEPFDDDDQFFFSSIAETVSSALKNASLMFAERKLAILEALVHVSSEITSTLRLDRLLQIVVNSPQNVLPFERCALALDSRGRLQLKAISGFTNIPAGDAQVEHLFTLLRWFSTQERTVHFKQHEEPSDERPSHLPEEIARHFETTGYRGLYAVPLTDDQGRVGLLLYESSNPDFLELPHTEMIKILASQATVAIRNALLYREVPLISLLEPLMQRKQALLRTSRGRRIGFTAAALALTLFLVFCPLPLRVTGDCTVGAQHLVTVAAPADGDVTAVLVHEGQRVQAGQLLATMNDLQWRSDLISAEARYRSAMLTMQSDLARGSAQAGADRAQVEFLDAEAARARTRIDNSRLRSPIDGIVLTPSISNAAGEHLDAGATFAQVLDLSSAVVDIAVPESEEAFLSPGQSAAIKLDSYPQKSWHGSVQVISAQATPGDGIRTFAARVPLSNDDALLRSGMTGRGKIFVSYRPAGYVMLRRPTLWVWQTLWNGVGW